MKINATDFKQAIRAVDIFTVSQKKKQHPLLSFFISDKYIKTVINFNDIEISATKECTISDIKEEEKKFAADLEDITVAIKNLKNDEEIDLSIENTQDIKILTIDDGNIKNTLLLTDVKKANNIASYSFFEVNKDNLIEIMQQANKCTKKTDISSTQLVQLKWAANFISASSFNLNTLYQGFTAVLKTTVEDHTAISIESSKALIKWLKKQRSDTINGYSTPEQIILFNKSNIICIDRITTDIFNYLNYYSKDKWNISDIMSDEIKTTLTNTEKKDLMLKQYNLRIDNIILNKITATNNQSNLKLEWIRKGM